MSNRAVRRAFIHVRKFAASEQKAGTRIAETWNYSRFEPAVSMLSLIAMTILTLGLGCVVVSVRIGPQGATLEKAAGVFVIIGLAMFGLAVGEYLFRH